jgi:hypothetical protein
MIALLKQNRPVLALKLHIFTEYIYVYWCDSRKRRQLFIYIYADNIKPFVYL